jgi:hypothetical protein
MLVLGFTGAVITAVFFLIKLVLMIVFSPFIIVFWILKWIWRLIF